MGPARRLRCSHSRSWNFLWMSACFRLPQKPRQRGLDAALARAPVVAAPRRPRQRAADGQGRHGGGGAYAVARERALGRVRRAGDLERRGAGHGGPLGGGGSRAFACGFAPKLAEVMHVGDACLRDTLALLSKPMEGRARGRRRGRGAEPCGWPGAARGRRYYGACARGQRGLKLRSARALARTASGGRAAGVVVAEAARRPGPGSWAGG